MGGENMTTDSWPNLLADLLPGLVISLQLAAAMLAIGLPLGLLMALGLSEKRKILSLPTLAIVEIGRGIPALVLLYMIYFGLPQVGMSLDAFLSAAVGLAISFASYTSEVFRAGLAAVPNGQQEAGHALGLPRATIFLRVLLPQALKVIVPPLLGWSIIYFQATSLAFALAVPELMSRTYVLATTNFQYLYMFALAAVLYATISIPLSLLSEHMSRRGSKTVSA